MDKKDKRKTPIIQFSLVLLMVLFAVVAVNIMLFQHKFIGYRFLIVFLDGFIIYKIYQSTKLRRIKDPNKKIEYIQKQLDKGGMVDKKKFGYYNQLSCSYSEIGDYEQALKYNETALDLLGQIKWNKSNEATRLLYLFVCLSNQMVFNSALDNGEVLPNLIDRAERVLKELSGEKNGLMQFNHQFYNNTLAVVKAKAALSKGDVVSAVSYFNEIVKDDAAYNEEHLRYERMLLEAEIKLMEGDTKLATKLLEQVITSAPNLGMAQKARILKKRVGGALE